MTYSSRTIFDSRNNLEFFVQNLGGEHRRYSGYMKVNILNQDGIDVTEYSNVYFSRKQGHYYFPIEKTRRKSFFRFPKIESDVQFSILELEYIPEYSMSLVPSNSWGKVIVLDAAIGRYNRYITNISKVREIS